MRGTLSKSMGERRMNIRRSSSIISEGQQTGHDRWYGMGSGMIDQVRVKSTRRRRACRAAAGTHGKGSEDTSFSPSLPPTPLPGNATSACWRASARDMEFWGRIKAS
jgi:hypothetical protein